MSLTIIKAVYGGKDVTDIVASHIHDNSIHMVVGHVLFGDPQPFVVKYTSITYELNGNTYTQVFEEQTLFSVNARIDYIPISCKCITYGRVEYLEESLASFLKQEYTGEYEMVIINDYPLQKLHFNHPKVRIYNLDFTFETIGEKENFAVSACKHDTIAVWDDDDLALPNHLSNINKYFTPFELLHWSNAIAFNNKTIATLGQVGNSGIVYNKSLWRRVGGHAFENAGYDTTFVNKATRAGARIQRAVPPNDEVSWLYCWGNGSYHMSGMGADDGNKPNVLVRHAEHIEYLRQQGKIPTGDVELNPTWKKDYSKMLKDYTAKNS